MQVLNVLLMLPATDLQRIWQQNQAYPSHQERWNAYLNHLSLNAILPWLQAESPEVSVWTSEAALPSFWKFVNGTAFTLNGERWVVIPTETTDRDELRVPQEWVDLPSWAADYYLAVQVEPDEGWIKIWGYTTHHTLKTRGRFDANDRTYCVDEENLNSDISLLPLSQELSPQDPVRAEIAPLPTLSIEQANNLIERLGATSVIFPRLSVPFQLWGALMEHGGWRQQLYWLRQGLSEGSVLQWLQTGISPVAQQLGWERFELQPNFAAARGIESTGSMAILARRLVIAGQTYELQVLPQSGNMWRFELRNAQPSGVVPSGFKLRLLTEDLQSFEGNEAVAETSVYGLLIEVALETGEGVVWEIEPISEGYDREILRF